MSVGELGNSAKPGGREGSEEVIMPSYESSMRNLEKARAKMRPPRPWRSAEESEMIRRLAFWWFTARSERPSARAWARGLGISHTWMQKLIREFKADVTKAWELQNDRGDPTFEDLDYARARTKEMRKRGEIRPFRRFRSRLMSRL